MNDIYDVIIGGAGPVGLFLACELGLAGVSVLLVERDTEISTVWSVKPLGVRGLNTLSAESFYRRGLLNKIFDPAFDRPANLVKKSGPNFAGHFAGMMFDGNKFDLSRWKYRLPGPSLLPGRTDLERIGLALSERAANLGVTILRGSTVAAVSQDSAGVSVSINCDDGNKTFKSKYLVGCDGGRSTIRKACGFEFVGTEALFTGYTTRCELDNPDKLQSGFQRTSAGMYIYLPEHNQVIVMDFDDAGFDRTQAVTLEHFQFVLRKVSGTDVSVKDLELASTFTDRALLAKTYRKERVFLAGDSAHIHSPLGGQGLNAGLGDAINLGWKLASVIKNTMPESLLDTYCEEREPIGAWVTEWTRAQVTTLKPDPFGVATAKIVRDLIDTVDGANYFIDHSWGLSQRYDLGHEHPLVGVSAPDFEYADGSRLGCRFEGGKGLLIDFTNSSTLAAFASHYKDQVDYINDQVKDNLGLSALLVRPDGIVAWLCEPGDLDENADFKNIGCANIKEVLLRWFGAPSIKSTSINSLQPHLLVSSSRSYDLV